MMIGEKYKITVESIDSGKRIDKFIAEKFNTISRTQIKKSFDANLIICNGLLVKPKNIISEGDNIEFRLIFPKETTLQPTEIPLDILFEDDDIIAINKSAGIVVHAGNGICSPTLVEGVLSHCRLSALGGNLRPGVVHRLDKDTSGVIIFAKSDAAYLQLIKNFAERKVKKFYQAIVCGTFSKNFEELTFSIGRNRTIRTKMAVVESGRKAVTRWELLKNFGQQFAHLKINILTGRTHQIRVHMSSIGHPIAGDTTYGYNKNYSKIISPNRVMLHAYEIIFPHPSNGQEITVKATLPVDFQSTLATLSNTFGQLSI